MRAKRTDDRQRISIGPIQEAIWIDRERDPGNNAYNISALIALAPGVTDVQLEERLARAGRAQPVLRAEFGLVDGSVAAFDSGVLPVLERVSLGVAPGERDRRKDEIVRTIAGAPFALHRAPLVRVIVIESAPDDRSLLIVADQIVLDGASVFLLAATLVGRIAPDRLGEAAPSPVAAAGTVRAGAAAYWRSRLEGQALRLSLPRELPAGDPLRATESATREIGAALAGRIRERSRSLGVTPYATLLSAFALLMKRLSGQTQLSIAIPVSTRTGMLRGALGSFVTVLPLVVDIDEHATAARFVGELSTNVRGLLRHRSYPVQSLIRDFAPPAGDPSDYPLASVAFNGLTFVDPETAVDAFVAFEQNLGTRSKYELGCYVVEAPDAIRVRLDYRTASFRSDTAAAVLAKYEEILDLLTRDTGRVVADCVAPERAYSPPAAADPTWYGRDADLRAAIRRCAEEAPNRPAVIAPGETTTYRELDARSSALARAIAKHAAAGERVGLLVDQTEVAVPLVAALKAATPYVALDPAIPGARLFDFASEAGVRVIVTTLRHLSLAREVAPPGATIIDAAVAAREEDVSGEAWFARAVRPDAEAYLLFTSGSTGRPKGVAQTHRAVLHFMAAYSSAIGITSSDRMSGLSSIGFDAFNNDFYGAVLNGAAYCPRNPMELADPDEIAAWLDANEVSVWHSVPGIFRFAAKAWSAPGRTIPLLRVVKLAGEPVRASDFALFERCTGEGARFVVSLGSTESSFTTVNALGHGEMPRTSMVPVGYPVARTCVSLRNDALRPAGILEVGEIFISSDVLPSGYAGDPEASAATFVTMEGRRWYRSGDLARRLLDGKLVILGRRDAQVKINGHRVEIGDVENALLGIPEIRNAAALVVERDGEASLTAYYVAAAPISAVEVRTRLERLLPRPIVPTRYVELTAFPLTKSGKIDRLQLPGERGVSAGGETAAEAGETGARVLRICSEIVRADHELSLDENLFTVGASSLSALRVVQRVNAELGAQLTLYDLFAAPTPRGIARAVDARRGDGGDGAIRLSGRTVYRLSAGQRRMWALAAAGGGAPEYHLAGAYELAETVDAERLETALRLLCLRHEALRTRIAVEDDIPVQAVDRETGAVLELVDARDWSDGELDAAIARRAQAPYDLAADRLFRVSLFRRRRRDVVVFAVHHAIFDARSGQLVKRRLLELYDALAEGDARSAVAGDALQYGDYAEWEHRQLARHRFDADRAYWLAELTPLPAAFPLLGREARDGSAKTRTARAELPPAVAEPLLRLAEALGVTPFACVFAAIAAVCAEASGTRELVLGVPVSLRSDPRFDETVGYFVNTLPVRVRTSDGDSFASLVRRCAEQLARAQSHAYYPLDAIAGDLALPYGAALFDVLVVAVEDEDRSAAGTPRARRIATDATATAPAGVVFGVAIAAGSVAVELRYRCAPAAADPVREILGRLERFAGEAVAQPNASLPLRAGEATAGAAHAVPPIASAGATISAMIDARFRANPDACAIVHGTRHWSYRRLDRRSRELGAALAAELGVRPGDTVAVLAERGPELVAAILGILRSGAAFVALDARYPAARLRRMAEAAGVKAIVHDEAARALAGELGAARLHLARAAQAVQAGGGPAFDSAPVDPSAVAYVIFTSGSSGAPKGVAVTHENAVNFLRWSARTFGAQQRVLAATSVSFDLSIFELFFPLATGGTVLIVPAITEQEAYALSQPTIVNTVPSAIAALLESGRAVPRSVGVINLAGETLSRTLVRRLHEDAPAAAVNNLYGPSETTTYSTARLNAGEERCDIGFPIAATTIELLGRDGSPAPRGALAEIYIGGKGVAQGYLGEPALTAQRFVPAPRAHGERVFRTGDLARESASGSLEFHGRDDDQVKLRGHRIELGEILEAVREQPGVRDAAVVFVPGPPDRIVAYLSAGDDRAGERIAAALARILPPFMLPASYVRVDSIPRLPNGKADRRALRASAPAAELHEPLADLRDGLSESLRRLCEEVLGTPFAAGDHLVRLADSLALVRLALRMQSLTGVEIAVGDLLAHPTLAELARLIRSREARPIARIEDGGASHAEVADVQRDIFFIARDPIASAAYNITAAFVVSGNLDLGRVKAALDALIARHEALRARFVAAGASVELQLAADAAAELRVVERGEGTDRADGSDAAEEAARELGEELAAIPFALGEAPLFRVAVRSLSPRSHALVFSIHHIVADEWSLEVVMREFLSLYRHGADALAGAEAPIGFTRVLSWQRRAATEDERREAVAFWRKKLAGLPVLGDPTFSSPAGSSLSVELSAELSGALKALARSEESTVFAVFAAAFAALLQRERGENEIVVGVPVSGRSHWQLLEQVGPYVSLQPVRLTIAAEEPFAAVLQRARRELFEILQQRCSFSSVSADLRLPYRNGRHPVFDATVAMLDVAGLEQVELGAGTVMRRVDIASSSAKFGLSVFVLATRAGFSVKFEFRHDYADAARIARTAKRFQRLLADAAADPYTPVCDLGTSAPAMAGAGDGERGR